MAESDDIGVDEIIKHPYFTNASSYYLDPWTEYFSKAPAPSSETLNLKDEGEGGSTGSGLSSAGFNCKSRESEPFVYNAPVSVPCYRCFREHPPTPHCAQYAVYIPRENRPKDKEPKKALSSVSCDQCSKKHPPTSSCPDKPCRVFYKVGHSNSRCPFTDYIPQGAEFNKSYEIICQCGHPFNVDKWICTSCGWNGARFVAKSCMFCHGTHGAYECPEHVDAAAAYKLDWEATVSKLPNLIELEDNPEHIQILESMGF